MLVHRAKGLEASCVWIIQPEKFMDKGKCDSHWEQQQEKNLVYVALTRAVQKINVIGNINQMCPEFQQNEEKCQEEYEDISIFSLLSQNKKR
jgi:DNA helicase-2/ATP-dependent DNA helicase PcrA